MVRRGAMVLLILILSLLTARPVGAARQVELDVILLVDTSDSMADELQALCRGIDDVVADMDRRRVAVNATVLGVADTRGCTDGQVTRLVPEGETLNEEDWGSAVTDLARHFDWTPDAHRLIVVLSDEGPLQGDPIDDDDERSIRLAVRAAQANDVMVSVILGTQFNSDVQPLARDLAQETGGQLFESQRPEEDLLEGLRRLIREAAKRARANATLLQTIPTPLEIVLEGRVISTNLVLAILFTLVIGVAATLLQDGLGQRGPMLDTDRTGRLTEATRDLRRGVGDVLAPILWASEARQSQPQSRPRRLVAAAQLALVLVLMAFVGLFLQANLNPISWRGLALGLGLLLALLLINLVYDGVLCWLMGRVDASAALRLQPAALLLTLASVLLSRIVGFVPGFYYVRAMRCDTASPGVNGSRQRRARLFLAGLGALVGAGLVLWLMTIPTSLLLDFIEGLDLTETLEDVLVGLVGAVQGFFALGFFVAWQTLFFELLPLGSGGGGLLFRRNRLIWAVFAAVVLFVLLHALVNPFGAADEVFESGGVILLLLFGFLYSALAVGLWLFLSLRASEGDAADRQRAQRATVMAVSLIVLWGLAACSGLLLLLVRWLG